MFADSFCSSSSLARSRRGWTTFASFAGQAVGVTILLAIPILYTEGLPQVRLRDLLLTPPPASAAVPTPPRRATSSVVSSNLVEDRLMAPRQIPMKTAMVEDPEPAPSLPFGSPATGVYQGPLAREMSRLTNTFSQVAPPAAAKPVAPRTPPISRWMEGNIIRRVQPLYPPLARSTGIQGSVLLRAVIGREGRIESVQVLNGHPLLVKAAVDAVSQWLYRPYYLNDQPVEVETQVTVNFVLGR
jgi:protein TonB